MEIQKGTYRHFKGNFYELIDIAKHSETLDDYVIYRSLYGDRRLWIRPLNMFFEEVEYNGNKVKRFTLIEDNKNQKGE